MIESRERWKSDIKRAERIWKKLDALNNELRGINPEHVSTSFARQHLSTAIGQLNATVMEEKIRFRREAFGKAENQKVKLHG